MFYSFFVDNVQPRKGGCWNRSESASLGGGASAFCLFFCVPPLWCARYRIFPRASDNLFYRPVRSQRPPTPRRDFQLERQGSACSPYCCSPRWGEKIVWVRIILFVSPQDSSLAFRLAIIEPHSCTNCVLLRVWVSKSRVVGCCVWGMSGVQNVNTKMALFSKEQGESLLVVVWLPQLLPPKSFFLFY